MKKAALALISSVAVVIGVLGIAAPASAVWPTPNYCRSYSYDDGTNWGSGSLCDRFNSAKTVTCSQVGYRVLVNNPSIDPWKLDDGIVGNGYGCESYPIRPV